MPAKKVFEEKILSQKISEAPSCWAWRFFLQNRRLDFRMTAQHNSFDSRICITGVTCSDFWYYEVFLVSRYCTSANWNTLKNETWNFNWPKFNNQCCFKGVVSWSMSERTAVIYAITNWINWYSPVSRHRNLKIYSAKPNCLVKVSYILK